MTRSNESYENKLASFRDRLKLTEKNIYEKVENEYESLVKDKD
jgi:hypothetical protein